ncbi:hypothetical protein IE3_05560 [Bacillus cereus BAG3X2-1]|nr:hypothetical protein IE3_05560 [Bacillus cereus BAG3X2-1]
MSKRKKTIEELLGEALVPKEKQPFEVPDNWQWTKLGSVFEQEKEQIQPIGNEKYIGLEHLKKGGRILEIGNAGGVKSKKVVFKTNDVLYGKLRPYLNKHALVNFEGVASTDILVYRNENIFTNKLLNMYLDLPFVLQYTNENSNGINLPRVSPKSMEVLPFPLPPLKEQKRITEKVERLLNKIEEAKQLIEGAKETFELRRAATLDKAFRGELTKEYRESQRNKTNIELENNIVKKFKSQLDPKIKGNLYVLPEGWKWVEVNDLIENMTYGTSSKTNDDVSGTPIIRMGNIQEGKITKVNYKYLPTDHPDVLKFDVQTNDILFNRTNSYELVGKSAIITEEFDGKYSFASYLIRLRLIEKDILAPYIVQFINSHIGREMLLSMVTQQVGQANINSQKLASLMIPLPTIEEIKEINKWLKKLDDRERNTIKILELDSTVNNLKQSILSKAFKGKLGTSDPNDEPAIELLKLILQEK